MNGQASTAIKASVDKLDELGHIRSENLGEKSSLEAREV